MVMPVGDEARDPSNPWRVRVTEHSLQADATVVPEGPVRIAVEDQTERSFDLLVVRAGGTDAASDRNGPREDDIIGRIPPAGADRTRELIVALARGRYALVGDDGGDRKSVV